MSKKSRMAEVIIQAASEKVQKTAEQKEIQRKELLVMMINSSLERVNKILKQFSDDMAGKSPLYTLSWADKVLAAAADKKWLEYGLDLLKEDEETLANMRRYVLENLLDRQRVPHSSSHVSNLADDAEREALFNLLGMFPKN